MSGSQLEAACRVCLAQEGARVPLHEARVGGGAPPATALRRVARLPVDAGSGAPRGVCPGCLRRLDRVLDFLDQLERTERALEALLLPHDSRDFKHEAEHVLESTIDELDCEVDVKIEAVEYQNCHKINNVKSNVAATRPRTAMRRGRQTKQPARAPLDFRCDVCGLEWSGARELAKHKRTHRVEQEDGRRKANVSCDVCGRVFKYAGNLKAHRRLHTGERPFACDMCSKTFGKKDNLVVHRKRHMNKREFPCVICGSLHYTAHELRMHQLTHSGDKPHACSVCGKRFTARNNLYIHYRTHTGEKPHQCNECGKKFISTNTLAIHKRIHTGEKPYICSVCGKSFANNKLAAHMRTHTGEKRHICTLCGRQFGSPNVLAIHMRRHTGEKPYHCTVCGQRYGHTQSLNKHMRRQHTPYINNVKVKNVTKELHSTKQSEAVMAEDSGTIPLKNSVSCITLNPLSIHKQSEDSARDLSSGQADFNEEITYCMKDP